MSIKFEAMLRIPLFVRTGKRVERILSFNDETRRAICEIEGGLEREYDWRDIVHHNGEEGKRAHLEAAGFPKPKLGTSGASRLQPNGQAFTTRQTERLVRAAKRWAAFQEPDSLDDQKTDSRLQSEAFEARERLLQVIDELPSDMAP